MWQNFSKIKFSKCSTSHSFLENISTCKWFRLFPVNKTFLICVIFNSQSVQIVQNEHYYYFCISWKKVSTSSQRCTHTVFSFQRESQWKWLHLWNPITRVDPLLFHLHRTLRHFYNNSSAIDSNLNPILVLLSRRWIAGMNAPPFSWYLPQFVKCMRILGLK